MNGSGEMVGMPREIDNLPFVVKQYVVGGLSQDLHNAAIGTRFMI